MVTQNARKAKEFYVVENNDGKKVPEGWRIVTHEEAITYKTAILEKMPNAWTISELGGGWKLEGEGYGASIVSNKLGNQLGHQVVLKETPIDNLFDVVEKGNLKRNERLVNIEELQNILGRVLERMDEVAGKYSIAELSGGWKVSGNGYGGKVEEMMEGEELGHQVVTTSSFIIEKN